MSVQPLDSPGDIPVNVIRLGEEKGVVVPISEYRRLRALERHASPEALEEAEMETASVELDEWLAASRPGAKSHEEFMAELFGGNQP